MRQLIHILEFDDTKIDTITLYKLVNDKQQFNEILQDLDVSLDLSQDAIDLGAMPKIDKERLRSAIAMHLKEVKSESYIDLTLIATIIQFSPNIQHQLVSQANQYLKEYDSQIQLQQVNCITRSHIANVRPKAKEELFKQFLGLNDNRLPLAVYERGFVMCDNFYVPAIRIEPALENELTDPIQFDEDDAEADSEDEILVVSYND